MASLQVNRLQVSNVHASSFQKIPQPVPHPKGWAQLCLGHQVHALLSSALRITHPSGMAMLNNILNASSGGVAANRSYRLYVFILVPPIWIRTPASGYLPYLCRST